MTALLVVLAPEVIFKIRNYWGKWPLVESGKLLEIQESLIMTSDECPTAHFDRNEKLIFIMTAFETILQKISPISF